MRVAITFVSVSTAMTVRIVFARTAIAWLSGLDGLKKKLGIMRCLGSKPMFGLGIDSLLE